MEMAIHTYIPQDRLRAIANYTSLPDRTSGSALFADISGFTALTESLRESLGTRRGAEELSRQLELAYSALISEVEKNGGSVIDFAGDAIMCWFDGQTMVNDQSSATCAVVTALGMQSAIQAFPGLALKVSIASGSARRFLVGDENIQRLDTLAGATVARAAAGEHLATKGGVLVDEATASLIEDSFSIEEWRVDEGKQRFAVLGEQASGDGGQEFIFAKLQSVTPDSQLLRPFIHRAVFEREHYGQASFLTEFRPCVALFLRFLGIDYEADDAEKQLDAFVRRTQTIVDRYDGTFLQITIGDKGSYAYINFGVLSAHEDNARRAVRAALEIKNSSALHLQIGITQGTLRVGAYGGHSRKTFGALGDEVNLAARLMMTASAGEILVSSHVHKAVEPYFAFEPRPPVAMKGKAEPVPVFAVTGERKLRAIRLQEPDYALPMVGRANELKIIEEKLDLALSGKSQVIGIIADAGMGKSRLVAEVIRLARRKGFGGYGGACQSDGVNTPYLSWKPIWSAFFDIDPAAPLKKQMRALENALEDYAPGRLQAIPLLNSVLEMDIPENDFTSSLQPQYRKSALTALFEDCVRSASKDEPILIVVEDVHWIDALSHDLLEDLAKVLVDCPVCFVLAYRPPHLMRLQAPRLEALPQFTKIELHELGRLEAEQAIRAKLTQLYPARTGAIPAQLVDKLMERAQGNPFYLEELLNYLRDRGLDPRDPADLQKIELPDSLHALVLSRIDQLSEREKTTLRVASIVGRLFRAEWLTGYYPALGDLAHVKVDLDKLERLDITPLDSETELAYLFKHIVTHEVTYESLPFGLRAQLHEQLARYLEKQVMNGTLPEMAVLDTLAFHYSRSNNAGKQREYLRRAGETAQKDFASDAALEYYGRLLPLLDAPKEQAVIHLKRGQVLELMGKLDEAESDYRAALDLSKDDAALKASTQFALGRLSRMRGEFELALQWLVRANEVRTALGDNAGLAQVLIETGWVLRNKGEYTQAREPLNEGLILARQAGNELGAALAVNELGNVADAQGDRATAQALYEESLNLRRGMGDKWGIAASLNDLGVLAHNQGDYATAQVLCEESLSLLREMGDKWSIALSLTNLGNVAYRRGDHAAARALFEESLRMQRAMGDRSGIAYVLNHLGNLAMSQGDYATGQALYEESQSLFREMGSKSGMGMSLINLGNAAFLQGEYVTARVLYEECLALYGEMDEKLLTAYALLGLGLVDLAVNKPEAREHILHSLRLRRETGEQLYQTSSLVGVAGLVLHEGDAVFAAQLLGAVASALQALNAVMEEELIPFHMQTLAAAREQLGESAFQSAWEEGTAWSLEEAVRKVLKD